MMWDEHPSATMQCRMCHSPMTASSQGSAPASSFSSILASSKGTLHSLGTLRVCHRSLFCATWQCASHQSTACPATAPCQATYYTCRELSWIVLHDVSKRCIYKRSPGILDVREGTRHASGHGGDAADVKGRFETFPIGAHKAVHRLHDTGRAAAEYLPQAPLRGCLQQRDTLLLQSQAGCKQEVELLAPPLHLLGALRNVAQSRIPSCHSNKEVHAADHQDDHSQACTYSRCREGMLLTWRSVPTVTWASATSQSPHCRARLRTESRVTPGRMVPSKGGVISSSPLPSSYGESNEQPRLMHIDTFGITCPPL